MNDLELIEKIRETVVDHYGNLETPDFEFVDSGLRDSPYRLLVPEMEALGATVAEDTDPNTDVSLGFTIETDLELLFLQVSVLGPFACLRRVLAGNETELIGSEEECDTTLESGVYAILQRHGILLLNKDILLIPLPITLPNTPAAKATIYQALFSDDEHNF